MSTIETVILGPKSIALWFDELDEIDFSPDYQRTSNAWQVQDQELLIDSIINGFDIPKFYFADFTGQKNALNQSKQKYAVIDGKQRLTAIQAFLDGRLKLSKRIMYLNDPSVKLAGLSYQELTNLHPRIQRKFDGFILSIVGIRTDDRSLITELFLRLNKGRPLTGAELRNANSSKVTDYIRRISDHQFFKENIAFKTHRMQNYDAASKILLFELFGDFQDTGKSSLDKMNLMEYPDNELVLAEERIESVLDLMNQFDKKDQILKSEGLFPVIY
jgi:Protein of unknown function DUF262